MYVIRRVWETRPGQARRAATLIAKIGKIYEQSGQRNAVQVSFNSGTLPGDTDRVCMEWTAERIESPFRAGNVIPREIRPIGAQLRDLTVRNWIEFEELLTPDKYQD